MTSEEARALIRASGWQPHKRNDDVDFASLEYLIVHRAALVRAAPDPEGGWMVGFGESKDSAFAPFNRMNCFWFPTEEQARACATTIKLLGSMGT